MTEQSACVTRFQLLHMFCQFLNVLYVTINIVSLTHCYTNYPVPMLVVFMQISHYIVANIDIYIIIIILSCKNNKVGNGILQTQVAANDIISQKMNGHMYILIPFCKTYLGHQTYCKESQQISVFFWIFQQLDHGASLTIPFNLVLSTLYSYVNSKVPLTQ